MASDEYWNSIGPWVACWRCEKCERELTWDQVMQSHSVCPLCGNIDPDPSTIVQVTNGIKRRKRRYETRRFLFLSWRVCVDVVWEYGEEKRADS